MPIAPNFTERMLFRLNLAPAPMLDFFGALAFRTASTALKLGVFEAVSDGAPTADEVAGRIGGDPRGTTFLLDALGNSSSRHRGRRGARRRGRLRGALSRRLRPRPCL